jgi:hypothetical protein
MGETKANRSVAAEVLIGEEQDLFATGAVFGTIAQ